MLLFGSLQKSLTCRLGNNDDNNKKKAAKTTYCMSNQQPLMTFLRVDIRPPTHLAHIEEQTCSFSCLLPLR